MSMIPIQYSLAAWGGGYDGDVRDAEKTAYLHRTRHYLHAFWPKECEGAGDTSGIACMMVLARHMNNGITDYKEAIPKQEGPGSLRLWEEKVNPLLRLSWKAVPLQTSEQYEMLRKEMIQVDVTYKNQYSFEFCNNSELMSKTLWDRPQYRLFGSMIAKDDEAEWEAAKPLGSHVIEIDNAKTGKIGFDVSAAIKENCGSFPLEGTETGERFDFTWCPEVLRVRYTPSGLDYKHLDALHSFNVELPCGLDFPQKQECQQYNLTAAVRLRGAGLYEEDNRDRIRLFAASGYDIYPEAPSPYADMKWDLAEYGHTYCLYYHRTRAHRMPPLTHLERQSRDVCDAERRSAEYREIFDIMSRKDEGDKTVNVYDMMKPELRKNYPQERRVIDMSEFRPWPRSRRALLAVAPAPEVNEEDVEMKNAPGLNIPRKWLRPEKDCETAKKKRTEEEAPNPKLPGLTPNSFPWSQGQTQPTGTTSRGQSGRAGSSASSATKSFRSTKSNESELKSETFANRGRNARKTLEDSSDK